MAACLSYFFFFLPLSTFHLLFSAAPPSTPQIDADCQALDAAFKVRVVLFIFFLFFFLDHHHFCSLHFFRKGVGTKEDQLIAVLCTKPKDYIQQLRAVYNHSHTVDLLSKIQLETSGRFQVFV